MTLSSDTRERFADVDYSVRLRHVAGRRPIAEWRRLSWAECLLCGVAEPYAPADAREAVYDGDTVVCPDCGCVGSVSVDDDGAAIVWRDDEALTDAAFAGLRRLLRLP